MKEIDDSTLLSDFGVSEPSNSGIALFENGIFVTNFEFHLLNSFSFYGGVWGADSFAGCYFGTGF